MISKQQKLHPETLGDTPEMVPIRNGFGEGLLIAAERDERVVGLCADLVESTRMEAFAKKFPKRFIEVGVAEQNLASVASGMAAMGKIPFISSYAMFSPGRNWEQIRTTICYNDVPVKIAGSHAGISVGPDGGTHQAVEDIALMRVIPNMVVLSPCDVHEARKATIAAAQTKEPTYIRLAREKTVVITTEDSPFTIGKATMLFEPKSGTPAVGIIATGALVHKALKVAQTLEQYGTAVSVLNMSTIKPLDTEAVLALAKSAGALVTVEEHQMAGGLGSAVAELLAEQLPTPIAFVGIRDRFGQSGTPEELITHYGMDEQSIHDAVKTVLTRKK
jgi:transketolase